MAQNSAPRAAVGILGGGQLARMLAWPVFNWPQISFPGSFRIGLCRPLGKLHQARFSDLFITVQAMAADIDLATFDFEKRASRFTRSLAAARPFHPGVDAGKLSGPAAGKRLLQSLGIP
jgi:phosphoribosylaminoimidazole carboxylase (NCAIR synthetase)